MAKVLVVTATAKYLLNSELKYTYTKTVRIPLTITFPSLPSLPAARDPTAPVPYDYSPSPKITFPKLPSRPNLSIGLPKFGDPADSAPASEYDIEITTSSHTE